MGVITEYRTKKYYNNNDLSVIFDTDSFFYALFNKDQELVQAVKFAFDPDQPEVLGDFIKSEKLDILSFNAIKLFSKSSDFTFIPSSEYNYSNEEELLRNAFPNRKGSVSIDLLDDERIHILHKYDDLILDQYLPMIKDPHIHHISKAWISFVKIDGLFVFISQNKLELMVKKQNRLHYYNCFSHNGFEDVFYFIMLCYDQLGLDPTAFPLILEGDKELRESTLILLKKYIRNIGELDYGNTVGSDLLDLYAVSLCE